VVSPLALIIVLVHALIQFRRMLNEEKVLKATFPEYEHYAARTPRLLPFTTWSRLRATTAASAALRW
jgi:protein-S-isoprenylcysteine O-methyltransferase Ste14